MKKILSVILVFAMVLCFASCGGKTNTAESALNNGLAALKNLDIENIQKYFIGEDITNAGDFLSLMESEEGEMVKSLFKALSWKVLSCEETGDTATASVELTCLSIGDLLTDLMSKVMADYLTGKVTDANAEEYTMNLMAEMFKDPNAKKLTETITITLNNVDGQWKIENDDAIGEVILSGAEDFLSAFTDEQ